MPPKKKTAAPKKQKSFEESLWDTANKLRGSVESSGWSGATKTARQGCPQGERGCANQNGSPLLHLSFSLLTSPAKGEGEIRQKMVENDLVDTAPRDSAFPQSEAIPQVVSEAKDNMIALPAQLFYTTQIPVCLWFLTKNKKADSEREEDTLTTVPANSLPLAA